MQKSDMQKMFRVALIPFLVLVLALGGDQGRLAHAYKLLSMAIKLDTNDVDLHYRLGLFYLTAGQAPAARNEALYVLDHRPDDPDAPLLLSDAALTPKDYDAVRER